jgi:hypothetical protein
MFSTMKKIILISLGLCVVATRPALASEQQLLETALNSSRYFESFSGEAIRFISGQGAPQFPVFDKRRAQGQPARNGQLPPCDKGGQWYPIDESSTKFVCIDDLQNYYCPYGTEPEYIDNYSFYCEVNSIYENRTPWGAPENDNLAIEGLKWFNRSQAHAALKFSQALDALLTGNSLLSSQFKNEGCNQYNESSVALSATGVPANFQPVGFINNALLNDMKTALSATSKVVCN